MEYTVSTFTLRALISSSTPPVKHINSLQCLCECAILRRPVFSRWLCFGEQLSVWLDRWEASCPVWDNRALGPSEASYPTDNSTYTHLHHQTSMLSCLCWKPLHWLIWIRTHHFPMHFYCACGSVRTKYTIRQGKVTQMKWLNKHKQICNVRISWN